MPLSSTFKSAIRRFENNGGYSYECLFLYTSLFRANKKSPDIVYYSEAMGMYLRVTKAQFLAENPGLTEKDFTFYKSWSDANFEEQYKHDRREGRDHGPLDESLAPKNHRLRDEGWLDLIEAALDMPGLLTETQHRRLMLHCEYGLSTGEIARIEGCNQSSVSRSISEAKQKIKEYFYGTA